MNFKVPCLLGHGECNCVIAQKTCEFVWKNSQIGDDLEVKAQEILGYGMQARIKTIFQPNLLNIGAIKSLCSKENSQTEEIT